MFIFRISGDFSVYIFSIDMTTQILIRIQQLRVQISYLRVNEAYETFFFRFLLHHFQFLYPLFAKYLYQILLTLKQALYWTKFSILNVSYLRKSYIKIILVYMLYDFLKKYTYIYIVWPNLCVYILQVYFNWITFLEFGLF